ncbi:MAG: GAF domain-containing protein, partial [Candidatus Korobacteraceae bacterium]
MADVMNDPDASGSVGSATGERRGQLRTQVLETTAGIIPVDLEEGASGIILDLTPIGMMVQSLSPLMAGESRTVSFLLPGTSASLRIPAVVVWSDPEGRVGLRFNTAPEGRKQLESWLASSDRHSFDPGPEFDPFANLNFGTADPLPAVAEPESLSLPAGVPTKARADEGARPRPSDLESPVFSRAVIPATNTAPNNPAKIAAQHATTQTLPPPPPASTPRPSMPASMAASSSTESEHQGAVNAMAWTIVEEISRLIPAHGAVVAVAQDNAITCRASWGSAPGVGARLQPQVGLSGESFRTGNVVLCNDAENDPRVPTTISQRLNLKSILVAPVLGTNGSVGLLEALSCDANAFSEAHVRILTRLAASLAEVMQPELRRVEPLAPAASAPSTTNLPAAKTTAPPRPTASPSRPASSSNPATSPAKKQAPLPAAPPRSPAQSTGQTALAKSGVPAKSAPAPASAGPSRLPAKPVAPPTQPRGSGVASAPAPVKVSPAKVASKPQAAPPSATPANDAEIMPLASPVQVPVESLSLRPSTASVMSISASEGLGGMNAESSNRSKLVAAVAAVLVLAIAGGTWTILQSPDPEVNAAAPGVSTTTASDGTAPNPQGPEAAEPARPTDEAQRASLPSSTVSTPPSGTLPDESTRSVRPVGSRQPVSSPTEAPPQSRRTPVERQQAAEPENDVAIYAVGLESNAIRKPVAVPQGSASTTTVAAVQPPPSIGGEVNTGAPRLPSNEVAPRLGAPAVPVAAKLIRRVEPSQPASARSIGGAVVLSGTVGTDGSVSDIRAVSGHPLLVGAATTAFRDWKYDPAMLNGKPVAST